MMKRTHLTGSFRLLAGALLCLAGCRTTSVIVPESKVLGAVPALAVPQTAVPPVVDGLLSDPAWQEAAVIPVLFPALALDRGPIAVLPTTVRVLWDEHYLYIGFECVDNDVYYTGARKHDDLLFTEDVCEVFLDGVGDGRQFVEVQVNPEGVNLDLMYVFTKAAEYTPEWRLTPELCRTDRWKFLEWEMTGLRTAARKTATGWTAELAIPAEAVIKRKGSAVFFPTEIRANLIRYDWTAPRAGSPREIVQQNWSPVLLGNPHNSPARMGRLNLTAPLKEK